MASEPSEEELLCQLLSKDNPSGIRLSRTEPDPRSRWGAPVEIENRRIRLNNPNVDRVACNCRWKDYALAYVEVPTCPTRSDMGEVIELGWSKFVQVLSGWSQRTVKTTLKYGQCRLCHTIFWAASRTIDIGDFRSF